jgi:hypothetical protein
MTGIILSFSNQKNGSTDSLFDDLTARQVVCAKRGGGIRFSPHFYTPFEVIDRAFALIEQYQAAR